FCEIAVPADVRVCADVESDPTVDSTEENWTGLMFRTGVHVQYIVLEEGGGLVVHVQDGFGTQTREEGGLLPASASLRWQVALSYDDGLLIRIRAFEQSDDPEAWAEFHPTTAVLPSAPEWFGFATNDPVGAGEDPALVVHSLRIQSPSTPARRWTAIADVPADPELVIELLARKNRASSLAGWSRDAEALADSDKTFADYTPTLRL
ncbi:hypothetical protein, partial [Haliangium sp.]|uniref:hypothetical protein n=1 Tax=Haliangium sp. TaxID=2663208 RepID=UPI003D0A5D6C